ncbi:MAG: SLOG family protein [Eubacteriales bacterium]
MICIENSCCFTGHRPNRLPWGLHEDHPRCLQLKREITEKVQHAIDHGITHFISGMAIGSDTYFAEIVLALREEGSPITLECALPCQTQADGWTIAQQERYHNILNSCNFETLVQHHYTKGCMQRRNRYMVDRGGLVLCVYDGKPKGGTAQTIAYALKCDRKIEILEI